MKIDIDDDKLKLVMSFIGEFTKAIKEVQDKLHISDGITGHALCIVTGFYFTKMDAENEKIN